MTKPPAGHRHAIRIFVLVGVALAGAVVARTALVPKTFGEHGHYRFAAIEEAKQLPMHHAGAAVCADCHDDIVALHDKDAHTGVTCETCHGPGLAHVDAGGDGAIRRPDGRDACLVCHRLMLARPGEFPQVTPAEHLQSVGVADLETPCITCHDPHEPLFMDRDVRTARLHPLIHRCRDCHAGRLDESLPRPAAHPAIFECNYCHPEVAADFAGLPHHEMRCTSCHLFFRESESAGRILRDADPRFCLLCHRAADYRAADAAPGIAWPEHLDEMAGPDERDHRCVDCHQDRIHRLQPVRTAGP
jgi:hypothetical protein